MSENNWFGARKRVPLLASTLVLFLLSALTYAPAEGFPIKSEVVRKSCGGCHSIDAEGRMSRISYVRKTPEGWEDTIRRMVRLHGYKAEPAEARAIVQYLSDAQGLTASEVEKIAYVLERRTGAEMLPGNEAVKDACTTCHSYAKIAAQRRTREEWLKLKDFLLATQPTIPQQHRHLDWIALADQALAYFAERFPLQTPEWEREKDKTAPGATDWIVVGHEPGKGDYFGTVKLTPSPSGEQQSSETAEFLDGSKLTIAGRGHWFGAYSWRGSVQAQDGRKLREVMYLFPDQRVMQGRSYFAEHPELGIDEKRYRADGATLIVGVFPKALKQGTRGDVRIVGVNLPPRLSQLTFGPGVTVEKITRPAPYVIVATVQVSGDADVGSRDVQVASVVGPSLFAVYDKVDYIRVAPEKSIARNGGLHYPKQMAQYEVHGFNRGADGTAGTADDLDLGIVKANWKLAEAVAGHDDVKYAGTIDQTGLFTPAVEGPNPARPHSTNNVGELWVEATYTAPGEAPLHQRGYLLVTVPLYFANAVR